MSERCERCNRPRLPGAAWFEGICERCHGPVRCAWCGCPVDPSRDFQDNAGAYYCELHAKIMRPVERDKERAR